MTQFLAANPRLDDLKILLVDDSPDNQRLFQRILMGAGARVDLACNGLDAVQLQASESYDAIIMDIRMPILDGYEASRRIRANGFVNPIIALTAHATPGEEGRCRGAGCSEFLLKPIDRQGLLKAVRDAVDSFHEHESQGAVHTRPAEAHAAK